MLSEDNKFWDETDFWKISGFDHAWSNSCVQGKEPNRSDKRTSLQQSLTVQSFIA